MPPKGSRGRGGSTAAAVGGRASSRIAEKQEAAQQLAQQGAALAAENEAQAQAQARAQALAQAQAEAGTEPDAQAQQAQQAQQDSHPKIEDAENSPGPESSMAPPAPNRGRTRGGRGAKSGEAYARRGTRRGSRGGSSIASFQARNTPATSDVYALHQQNAPGEKIHPLLYAHHILTVTIRFCNPTSHQPCTNYLLRWLTLYGDVGTYTEDPGCYRQLDEQIRR